MSESNPNDIRRYLKKFGIQVDAAVSEFFADHPDQQLLRIRLSFEIISGHGQPSESDLVNLSVEGEIER